MSVCSTRSKRQKQDKQSHSRDLYGPRKIGVVMDYIGIGTLLRLPYGHALISVVVDGAPQEVYWSFDGSKPRFFVIVRPGPYQLQVEIPTSGAVELLTYDGTMPDQDVAAMLRQGNPGDVFPSMGTYVVEQMVGPGSRTPLVFSEGGGLIYCRLFNQRQWGYSGDTLDMVAYALAHDNEYERGPEIAQATIGYGPELPV